MSTPTDTFDPISALTRALSATEQIAAGIGADQWSAGTVCADWDVRGLLDHLVSGNHQFIAALGGGAALDGGTIPAGAQGDADLVAAYRRSATGLQEAFAGPGALEQIVTVPFGTVPGMVALHLRITEILVHGWDLARATGQPTTIFPDDVAGVEVEFSEEALKEIPDGESPFGASQPVAENAPGIDRLAALLGRRP